MLPPRLLFVLLSLLTLSAAGLSQPESKPAEPMSTATFSGLTLRSLGPEPLVQVDVEGPHPVRDGDTFVLCSDGLSGQLADNEIGAVATALPPDEACRFLVDLANLRGGPDNITVVIVRVGSSDSADDLGLFEPIGRPWYYLPWPLTALFVGAVLAAGDFPDPASYKFSPLYSTIAWAGEKRGTESRSTSIGFSIAFHPFFLPVAGPSCVPVLIPSHASTGERPAASNAACSTS